MSLMLLSLTRPGSLRGRPAPETIAAIEIKAGQARRLRGIKLDMTSVIASIVEARAMIESSRADHAALSYASSRAKAAAAAPQAGVTRKAAAAKKSATAKKAAAPKKATRRAAAATPKPKKVVVPKRKARD